MPRKSTPKEVVEVESTDAHSPLPQGSQAPPETINFFEAMRAVADGHHVTKLEWNNPNIQVWLDGTLKIKMADGLVRNLLVSDGDIYGDDWVVL